MIAPLIVYFVLLSSTWAYQFETCCSDDQTNTTRLLSCPLNFVIKLRSIHFYTGNGCSASACQKRLNKHYLPCNHHRTCSISIQCILMDSSTCPWLSKVDRYSQHLIVEYDCILHQSDKKDNMVLFSAKVNIESPPEMFNDSTLLDDQHEWKSYFLKKFFPADEKTTVLIDQKRSLFSDILRTMIILLIFALILIIFMVISLLIYKRFRSHEKKKFYAHDKHQPFPADEAYDNLKTNHLETASDSGTITNV